MRGFLHSSLILVSLLILAVPASAGAADQEAPASSPATVEQNEPTQKSVSRNRKLSKKERKELLRALPEKWHRFLEEVDPIILPEELDAFLMLESEAQREFFVRGFWDTRDNDPRTARNEFEESYKERLQFARENFKYLLSDRTRVLLIRGMPAERIEIDCSRFFQPLEIWYYPYLEDLGSDVLLIFYYPRIGADFRLWTPMFGNSAREVQDLLSIDGERAMERGGFDADFVMGCRNGDIVAAAISWGLNRTDMPTKIFERPEVDVEHAARTSRNTVVRNPDAPPLDTTFAVDYPGTRGTRTVVKVAIGVDSDDLSVKTLSDNSFYNLDVTGEVIRDGTFFETFRYRFDYPAEAISETVPVAFERFLRSNDYLMRIKVQDVNSGAESVIEHELRVPVLDHPVETAEQSESRRELEALRSQFFEGGSTLGIIPLRDDIQTGYTKVNTIVTGEEIEVVEFWLDGEKVMSKNEPPYTLELDLGPVPMLRRIRAVGLDRDGKLVAGDEIVINKGIDPFRIHIASPRIARRIEGPTRTVIELDIPRGKEVESVEIFLNEDRVAQLFEPPWVTIVDIPQTEEVGYLRAVATLEGEESVSTEDLVFLNRPEFVQELDVHLVELPTTVMRNGRPVEDLTEDSFRIFDEGEPVEIARFERVANVPLSVGIAIDSSASMEQRMTEAQEAAAQFFSQVLRKDDRAFIVGFSDVPVITNRWTNDLAELAGGLASLRAEATTALYDAIVYSLYNFQSTEGQKALIVLSDGEDTSSQFTWEQTLEYARRAGLPVYTIGIGISLAAREARGALSNLAEETGGRSWFPAETGELSSIYSEIERELRSQYLLGFYPSPEISASSDWREIEVRVDDARVRTIRGYYP